MVKRIEHIIENNIEKKRCCNCQLYRSLDNYNNSKSTWDKLRPECKLCLSEKRNENKEKMTEYNKIYWQETKEKQKETCKRWRENNKDKVKENNKKWLDNNKEYKKIKDKEYAKANWDKKKEYMRIWKQNDYKDMKINPNRIHEYNNYRIKSNLSRRIREILKQDKSDKTMNYIGCSLNDFKKYIESLFQEGMTWNNYGSYINGVSKSGWHIDHIIPCTAFDFKNIIEIRACFYYKNMQPLWGIDNIIKSDKYDIDTKNEYINRFKQIYETNSKM
jgi:hypothetical protein